MAIDASKIARRAGVPRTSVNRFIEILEDTLIAERIWSFRDTEADVIAHPKLFFFDVGVRNGLTGNFEISSESSGAQFEHLIYSLIRNSAWGRDEPCSVFLLLSEGGKIYSGHTERGAQDD